MIIKKKSMIVAALSSMVVSMALVLTLLGFLIYIELKGEEDRVSYEEKFYNLAIANYAKNLDILGLSARIGTEGVFKGKPILEGEIINSGYKNIMGILLKVSFIDKDGACITEVIFRPDEPTLGVSSLSHVSTPYHSGSRKIVLAANERLPFKKILSSCPLEIKNVLQDRKNTASQSLRWSGKLAYEVISLDF